MKRMVPVFLAAALAIGLISGCSPKDADKKINISSTVKSVMDAAGYTEELVELDDSVVTNSYTLLDMGKVEDSSVFVSGSMATPEELAIFKANSEEDAEEILKAVDRRLEDLTLNFEDYRPDEMPKIENAVKKKTGVYVLFAVCPNSDAVREIFDKL